MEKLHPLKTVKLLKLGPLSVEPKAVPKDCGQHCTTVGGPRGGVLRDATSSTAAKPRKMRRLGLEQTRLRRIRAAQSPRSFRDARTTDTCAARPVPIPVYAEMSSVNPVVILEGALRERADTIAAALVNSCTQGLGPFCTQPGLHILVRSLVAEDFVDKVAIRLRT